MTIGDYPELLAAGYLPNLGMIKSGGEIDAIEHDPELETIFGLTACTTNFARNSGRRCEPRAAPDLD